MTVEIITFALAMAGFLLLTTSLVMIAHKRESRAVLLATAGVVGVHVVLVWAFRYEWEFAQATRNGYAGFLIFHTALASLVVAPFAGRKHQPGLILFSFVAVAIGAHGAVFRYDVVAYYQAPVILTTLTGIVLFVRAIKSR